MSLARSQSRLSDLNMAKNRGTKKMARRGAQYLNRSLPRAGALSQFTYSTDLARETQKSINDRSEALKADARRRKIEDTFDRGYAIMRRKLRSAQGRELRSHDMWRTRYRVRSTFTLDLCSIYVLGCPNFSRTITLDVKFH